jgi:hypothetical protein
MVHTHLLEGVSSGVIDPELLQRLVAEAYDNYIITSQTISFA